MILVLLSTVATLAAVGNCQGTECCRHAVGFDSCSTACYEALRKSSHTQRYRAVYSLPKHCPGYLLKFWGCLRRSFPDGIENNTHTNYAGTCCLLANSSKCKNACYQARHSAETKTECSEKTEASLLRCVDRHEATRNCCYEASKSCLTACQVVFSSDNRPTDAQIENVGKQCSRWNEQHVVQCVQKVQNITKQYNREHAITSAKCCEKARKPKCRETCLRVFQTSKDSKEFVNSLEAACGKVELTEPLWQCFVVTPEAENPKPKDLDAPNPVTVIDGAKLQCCSKARSTECWQLCVQMFSTRWGVQQSWDKFDKQCAYEPSERAMLNCLADVTEPCQLGCSGLNYCTNFNDRPTELFRSCNQKSNTGAKHDMDLWTYGSINMPSMKIPVKDVTKCMPERWKAIACVLQIKPCHVKSHSNTICRKDCIDILEKCADKNRLIGRTVEDVCKLLSPDNAQSSCISINDYLTTAPKPSRREVTHPCHPKPCEAGICDINRKCVPGSITECKPYTCTPGCQLGEASSFLVRVGDQARVPVESGINGYFKVCQCSNKNKLTKCVHLDPIHNKACKLGVQGPLKNHDTRFHVDCNFCVCYSGEVTCTNRQCPQQAMESLIGRLKRNGQKLGTEILTGLPCGCSDIHLPLCGSDGRTYPNRCLAKCAGLQNSQIFRGACVDRDPCQPNPCNPGQKCIVDRKICLSLDVPCQQYLCTYDLKSCDDTKLEPVCDTDDNSHANLCMLHRMGKTFAYNSYCKSSCKAPYKKVCGIDGTTYSSHCTAFASRVLVDYEGECKVVGSLLAPKGSPTCRNVTCPKYKNPHCVGLIPPGACCPVCGAMVRILYSVNHLLVDGQVLSDFGPVTLEGVLEKLRRHVTTSECDLFGYLSVEGDLVVIVMAITENPTKLQVEACNKETLKIEALINRGSPALSSDLALSTLKGAMSNITYLSSESRSGTASLWSACSMFALITCLLMDYVICR